MLRAVLLVVAAASASAFAPAAVLPRAAQSEFPDLLKPLDRVGKGLAEMKQLKGTAEDSIIQRKESRRNGHGNAAVC